MFVYCLAAHQTMEWLALECKIFIPSNTFIEQKILRKYI